MRLAIVQPRIQGERYKEWSCTGKKLASYKAKFIKAAEVIYDTPEKAKLSVGAHCKYCPAKAICKAYGKNLSTGSSLNIIELDQTLLPSVDTLSDEQLYKIKSHSKLLRSYLDSVDDYLMQRAFTNKVTGTKLIWGRSISQWNKENLMEVEQLGAKYGVDIYSKKPKGITAIQEEIFVSIQETSGITPKKTEIKKMIEPYLVKTQPKLKVVLDSEKGDEVDPSSIEGDVITLGQEYDTDE